MKTRLLRILVVAVVIAGATAVVMVIRSALLRADPIPQGTPYPFAFDELGAPERLARALEFPTVTLGPAAPTNPEAWVSLHQHLAAAFPRVHDALETEVVDGLSLLYRWPGSDSALDPVLLSAHMDVVPAASDATGAWRHGPFSGTVDGGYIWGRGAMDAKGSMTGILEAIEGLLAAGFSPRRTVLLAFGHDGESKGEGARRIADILDRRGTHLSWVIGEGLYVVSDLIPGLRDPVGMVGVAEKGTIQLRLTARSEGGSESFPPRTSALGVLSKALVRLEDQAFPPEIRGPALELLDVLGPLMDPGTRLLVANIWLLERPLSRALTESPILNAALRTTISASGVESTPSGDSASVASALLGVGIAPWHTPDSVLDRVTSLLADLSVEVEVIDVGKQGSPVATPAASEAEGFRVVKDAIHGTFPDVVAVVPALTPHPTDAGYFSGISEGVYGFTPFRIGEENLGTIHGEGERVRVSGYLAAIRFYAELIRRGTE